MNLAAIGSYYRTPWTLIFRIFAGFMIPLQNIEILRNFPTNICICSPAETGLKFDRNDFADIKMNIWSLTTWQKSFLLRVTRVQKLRCQVEVINEWQKTWITKKKFVPSVTRVLLQKHKETENGFICLQVILIEILMKLLTFCNFELFF